MCQSRIGCEIHRVTVEPEGWWTLSKLESSFPDRIEYSRIGDPVPKPAFVGCITPADDLLLFDRIIRRQVQVTQSIDPQDHRLGDIIRLRCESPKEKCRQMMEKRIITLKLDGCWSHSTVEFRYLAPEPWHVIPRNHRWSNPLIGGTVHRKQSMCQKTKRKGNESIHKTNQSHCKNKTITNKQTNTQDLRSLLPSRTLSLRSVARMKRSRQV